MVAHNRVYPAQNGHSQSAEDSSRREAPAAIDSALAAGRSAFGHCVDLVRIGAWRVGSKLRTAALQVFLVAAAALVVLSVAVTGAIWVTIGALREIGAIAGGGLVGVLAAGLSIALVLGLCGFAIQRLTRRTESEYAARLDSPTDGKPEPEPEPEPLVKLARERRELLRRDGRALAASGSALVRRYPLASVGVGAAAGLAVVRSGRGRRSGGRRTRSLRRRAAILARWGRIAGYAWIADSLSSHDSRSPNSPNQTPSRGNHA